MLPEPLRLLTTQADLQYHAARARRIFNPPAATGMGFWSINPYVGFAFGCAYEEHVSNFAIVRQLTLF